MWKGCRHAGLVPPAAPRIDSRLVAALLRIDDPRRPIAETNRRLGMVAAKLELPKPSYEQVRVVLHALRRGKRDPGVGTLLLDIAFRACSPEQVLDALTDPK
jgi:hypothetical protein